MRLKVKVVPNSKKFRVEYDEARKECKAWVEEKPEKNKANQALVKNLSKLFGCGVIITSGTSSRNKMLEVGTDEKTIQEKIRGQQK